MNDKVIDLTKYRNKRNINSVLVTLDLKEVFQTKGKEFLIKLLEYITNKLKES